MREARWPLNGRLLARDHASPATKASPVSPSDRDRYTSALTSIWRVSESSTKCVRIWFDRQHTGQSSMYVMSNPPPMSGVVSTMFPQCGQRYATESPYRRCRRSMVRV